MNPNNFWRDFLSNAFSAMVNQALIRQSHGSAPLPQDQKEAEEKILQAIHDLFENKAKIQGPYQSQVFDEVILKIASEVGWNTFGGAR